jgi:hypothetical protein
MLIALSLGLGNASTRARSQRGQARWRFLFAVRETPLTLLLPPFVSIGKCQAPHKVYSPPVGRDGKQILLAPDGIGVTCHPEPVSEFTIRFLLAPKAAEYNEPFSCAYARLLTAISEPGGKGGALQAAEKHLVGGGLNLTTHDRGNCPYLGLFLRICDNFTCIDILLGVSSYLRLARRISYAW